MDITLESGLRIVRDAMEHLRVANLTLSGLKRIDSDSAYVNFVLKFFVRMKLLRTCDGSALIVYTFLYPAVDWQITKQGGGAGSYMRYSFANTPVARASS